MTERKWKFDTSHWYLISENVARDLRVFPVREERGTLIVISEKRSQLRSEEEIQLHKELLEFNLRRPVKFETCEEIEFNFDELLDDVYGPESKQYTSVPIAKLCMTILVVDDEPDRSKPIIDEMLHDAFNVLCFDDVDQALAFIAEPQNYYALILIADEYQDVAIAESKLRESSKKPVARTSSWVEDRNAVLLGSDCRFQGLLN